MNSSSSSPESSLSASSQNWIYDIFPSFRGEDVRLDFLSHIQKEFRRTGITPFIDNDIKRGASIGPELIRAIRGSKIALILVSKNYASSKWCLDELVEIMKCREEVGQTVMAIFYKVDPSHVKKLTGDFGKVFEKTCAGRSKEDIERWTQAFEKVAKIAGYDSSQWNSEAAMIERIVTDVSNMLSNSVPSRDFDGLVGMRDHMENLNIFLRLESNEVKMIGIWGPSGIGKNTIARVFFSRHSHQFQLSVFMENIKRRYPNIHGYDDYSADLHLQEKFLSHIINHKDMEISHLGVAQDRLKDKGVLVVLDDVDQSMQLDAMAKEISWFGPGSRIIITTQDKKLLTAHGIKHIYEVAFPGYEEALQTFCMNAFGQKSPCQGFEDLSWEVIELSGKLPLGLSVMGSHLKGITKEGWKRELPRLQTSLDGKIESILKFSYDALCDEDKDLFVYIACVFNNEEIEKVEAHLASNFSDVSQGLHILAEKSLISFTELLGKQRIIEMHDLLARFGREIVRKQSSQLLVDARDICKVLNTNSASRGSVIGAVINFSEIKDALNKCDNVAASMSCLQFLRLSHNSEQQQCTLTYWDFFLMTCLPSIFTPYQNTTHLLKNLPRKVRLLDWEYFPMTFLPSNFDPEFLVELKMYDSKLENLWRGNKTIRNLKWMDLSFSRNLWELPDLSTATNLRELNLHGCSNLVKLPSSILNAINLKELNLKYCSSLMELPSSIGNFTCEKLNLSYCKSLEKLPFSIGNAINLQILDLGGCWKLMELPYSIGNAINLKKLNLNGCLRIRNLPSSIGNAINLKELHLKGCYRLRKLPYSIRNATNLRKLYLSYCSGLRELPQLPDSLEILYATKCRSLERLHSSFHNIRFVILNFARCFQLNQEARDLIIIKTSSFKNVILPLKKVPTHFTNRASGSSLHMKLNGFNTDFPRSLRFKACVLLVNKIDGVDLGPMEHPYWGLYYHITEKHNGVKVKGRSRIAVALSRKSYLNFLNDHLHTFDVEEMVSSSELVFEFGVNDRSLGIGECGILYPVP